MKTLLIDIETRPNLAYVFDLWRQNISIEKLTEHVEVICFGAKWLGEKKVHFYSRFHDGDEMLAAAHRLLDEADVVMHYNGKDFDIPHLNREFLTAGMSPPSPYQQMDLLKTVRKQFNFSSNKLQYIAQRLGLEGKVQHGGFELWKGCMEGDPKAWRTMRRYNIQDVRLLEQLYEQLQPWIVSHPNQALYSDTDEPICNKCGSPELIKEGFAYTAVSKYQRYSCKSCGGWSRGSRRTAGAELREVAA